MLPYREYLEDQLSEQCFLVSKNYRQKAGPMVAEHWHPYQELLYVFTGQARQIINGTSFILHAGDTLLIAAGVTHATIALEDRCYIGVIIFSHIGVSSDSTIYLSHEKHGGFRDLYTQVNREFMEKKTGYRLMIQGLICEMLGTLQRYGYLYPNQVLGSGEGERMETYIRTHLSQNLRLEDVAKYAGYSTSYFSHYFAKLMGMPFKTYVDRMKMQAAKGMLIDGIRVTEIAESLGYETTSSFCRAFRRICGLSPSEYLINNKNCI